MIQKIKLINAYRVFSTQCHTQPPLDGWRLVETKGKRRIIRNIKISKHRTTEDLIRYVYLDFHKKYQESILKIKIMRVNQQRMGANRYIYQTKDGFYVRVGKKYLGWFKKFSKAKKMRDSYFKETAQSIQQ